MVQIRLELPKDLRCHLTRAAIISACDHTEARSARNVGELIQLDVLAVRLPSFLLSQDRREGKVGGT